MWAPASAARTEAEPTYTLFVGVPGGPLYLALLEPENDPDFPGHYSGEVLDLPGCIASGASASEALADLCAAIQGYLEVAERRRIPVWNGTHSTLT